MTTTEYRRRWDSLREGYLPPDRLEISPDLHLDTAAAGDIDAVTYEVLRSRLWSINEDHQNVIRRISGSGVTVLAWDFNSSIQTEDGEGVVFGPGILFFAGAADLVVKWTLEHRSTNVGVHPGDIFIQSDPWVGTNHQMDVSVYAPIFVEDRLFCWVYNVVHQQEIGGVEPGGFVQQAPDTYFEAIGFPPMKLVDRGVWREDLVDAWIRRSRLPELNLLEIKSQVAGVEFARAAIQETIAEYGPAVLKGVMRRMIDNAERAVRARIDTIPDGEWRDVRYVAGSLPGDRKLYRLALTVRKGDGTLTFSNAGTDPAHGSFNTTPGVWRAALLSSVLPLLAHDQYLCGAGVLRCLRFEPAIGSITSCRHPSACSTSLGTVTALTQSYYLLSKMMGSSPSLQRDVVAASCQHTHIYSALFGIDQHGRQYANLPLDCIAGGSGANSFRDGIDHGGGFISMRLRLGNVEEWERIIPFLYLYRRELSHAGGHGQWRGGTSLVTAWKGHQSEESFISSGGVCTSVTQGHGLAGAPPGTGGGFWHALDTSIEPTLASGVMPGGPEDLRALAPHGDLAPAKKFDNRLAVGDVFEILPAIAAGYGDPLLREPALVASDVSRNRLAPEVALDVYCVVLIDGTPDMDATEHAREAARAERLRRSTRRPASTTPAAADARPVGFALSTIEVIASNGLCDLACTYCHTTLAPSDGNYRDGCAWLETELADLDPNLYIDPARQVDGRLVLRQYLCPTCGYSLDADVCKPEDDAYRDVALDGAALSRA